MFSTLVDGPGGLEEEVEEASCENLEPLNKHSKNIAKHSKHIAKHTKHIAKA